ncbi:S-layer homology domain-containing protein [Paenibacillus allorhizosphaerae]|uniref:SLH domain-containing protein n=1 Tax=Paenibacillus allorhizosphaerae TaxID=2849866 RepID=A0ABM8VTX9_9BACL|nr:S-layer homology domain-containing protein [Paenibacillus allorhizosphaerae]CAG7657908.1 hypothetical protein PAECIP111802_06893 [Paenibacillus allorhizosphaerae]
MKRLKKAGTVAIASALLLTSAPQVWASEIAGTAGSTSVSVPMLPDKGNTAPAEVKISKDHAIDLAKKYIAIPEGYVLNSINLNSNGYPYGKNGSSWSMNFSKTIKDHYYGNISITIDGTNGRLTNYYMNENDNDRKPSYPPKADYKAAKQIADAWIAKMNAGEQDQLRYNVRDEQSFRTPIDGNYQYSIRYDRTVSGVPFSQNGVNVGVNGEGQVTSYSFNWDDTATFEKNVTPIGMEQAAQAFRDKAKAALSYEIPYQAKGNRKPITTYQMGTFMIDAAKGEPWSPGIIPQSGEEERPITDKPLADKPSATLNLTKEEAVEKVTSVFTLPAGVKLQNASYNEYTNPDTGETSSAWNLSWSQPAGENEASAKMAGSSAWATVDSKTGEIKNFNLNPPYVPMSEQKDVEAKVSQDEAKAKAAELVKKLLPGYTDQLVPDTVPEKLLQPLLLKRMKTWDIRFKRVIDGVSAGGETVYVNIDRETGDLIGFSNSISTFAYPQQKPQVIALDKAKDLLLAQYDIELSYEPDLSDTPLYTDKIKLMIAAGEIAPGIAPDASGKQKDAKLVYKLLPKYSREPVVLDAETGTWKNAATGDAVSLERVKVGDIEGHWAQKELQLMLDYQALDVKDGKVNPDQSITRGEMIKMLVIAMNGGNGGIRYDANRSASFADVKADSAYFAYVENAVDRGLLTPGTDFRPEDKMNREEMAGLIVKALGLSGLAQHDAVFNDNFADKAKLKHVGEAAIVVGLDIMSLVDGSFQPEQEVSKAQAATAFFRYLQKRAEIQDRKYPVYY